ncbi:DNA cytosine methyltransferase [Telluribacter sp.]|jgi:DNA (cytosine-5)-methyltransferase 1|uniref:DNA cytosine methyltransferase n=1 Tax=Telluribacter sp. TaxID=1978767 RepID=UPI002E0EA158|nr:DNA cytosine methyltransferase [Telluribacter sp.]
MGIPIIDLFAGPGGLGEGFTSLLNSDGNRAFKIGISVEKDDFAHQTLTLRSFVRQFPPFELPAEYYQFMRGEIKLKELYSLFPGEHSHAEQEAQKLTLGKVPVDQLDEKISNALNGAENWVLIGGPPCQAYSIVGRSRRGGINPEDERVYLYREYYRILAVHNPPVFVMENVKGILSSKVNDSLIFQQILSDLRDPVNAYSELQGKIDDDLICPGYNIYSLTKKPVSTDIFGNPEYDIRDFIIKAEEYGIPQARHRVILLGIRKDLNISKPSVLTKKKEVNVKDVISGLPEIRSGISKGPDLNNAWKKVLKESLHHPFFNSIKDIEIREEIINKVNNLILCEFGAGKHFIKSQTSINYKAEWYLDKNVGGACNHESRSHIVMDLYRYLFVSCFATVHGRSPKLFDFPDSLLPKHKNVYLGVSGNKFGDRFCVQLYDKPSKTITSHISKDGHYYIHPDSRQCRSFTVREAARIQTFPDNYYFCGSRTSQFHQVGNAVPPLLAYQIAEVVKDVLDKVQENTLFTNTKEEPLYL